MKHRLRSLRFRILLPVLVILVFTITMMNIVFTTAYIDIVLQQEKDVNTVRFEEASRTIRPLIETNINEVQTIMSNDLVMSYARLQYDTVAERIHARISCRDYLRMEMTRHEGIYGLLFMRKDGSLFGTLPDANFFQDAAEDNPLPENMKTQILNALPGQTVWVGPVSGASLYGFRNDNTPKNIMIAAWKSVNVSYGECFPMMLMDESVFNGMFSQLQDANSSWHLYTEDGAEIFHSGENADMNPERLISESNTGKIFYDENGLPVCSFTETFDSPAWTLVREVSMQSLEKVISNVKTFTAIFGGGLLLVVLFVYELWQKRFVRQFQSLLKGIARMGEGDLESTDFVPSSIEEFRQMQGEINRTRLALNHQMDTIRRMEREQMELENERKEQERIAQELTLAREIQVNSLPQNFPAFPDRTEFDLFASMTPAKEVGGDFYDFFLVDSDHLALLIADVSGKGIPAALFMMVTKTLIRNEMMTGCDPATALQRVNLQISEHNSSSMFVTVWLALLEISTGKGLVCNAGHEHPGFRCAGGRFEMLKYRHCLFVSGMKKAKFRNREFEMHPGDCIFVYTDGIPEAQNADKNMFGEKRLVEALNQNADLCPEELIHHVHETVNRFVDKAPQFDDLTMLCLKYFG